MVWYWRTTILDHQLIKRMGFNLVSFGFRQFQKKKKVELITMFGYLPLKNKKTEIKINEKKKVLKHPCSKIHEFPH